MCGIAGYFGKGNQDILTKMTNQLNHRGPDDKGFYVDHKIGLGHTRLSIIDLTSAGHQPMCNQDQTIWTIFNGEIYNFQELKKNLKNKFKSQTDTEVIIHLYEKMGEKVFAKLNGMFAIAVYDKKREKIILARDRMGKKPLYWCIFKNTLIFGSELKSLMQHPLFQKELNLQSLNKYLNYEYVPTPHAIFKNVYKLEPGTYMGYDGREIKKKKFWNITFQIPQPPPAKAWQWRAGTSQVPNILDELDKKIDNAVKTRLVSDVPLGIFLSGGLDSSAITYYAQKNSKQKIKTFSIGFNESSFNESIYAKKVSKFLGTEHYEKILNAKDSLDLIPKIADLLDEPMADSSIIPTYLLSKFTRQNVTVALGGDGGDELFCGYDTFTAHRLATIYEKIPLFFRKKIIENIATHLPTSFRNLSFDFKIKKFIAGFYGEEKYRNQRWLGSFNKQERAQLFTPEIWNELKKENEFIDIDNYLASLNSNNFYNQLIYLYLRTYLMDDILVKVDRASMFNSLEVRAPLLDYHVVDFVNSLPINLKMHSLQKKYIFKKLMENKLPKNIIYRKKKGFGIPLSDWLTKELKPLALNLFSKDKIESQGLFNYNYINKILNDHFSQRQDNRKLIWTLMIFQMWREKWLD
jgi:asparagine synthase (glutamine-hydrolysing)